MTLNKWFILMALMFGSFEAMAKLEASPAKSSRSNDAIERAALIYVNALAVEYPTQNVALKVDSSALNASQIRQIQEELFIFEQAMRGEVSMDALKGLQYVSCAPCGGGGGGCKPPVCRSNFSKPD